MLMCCGRGSQLHLLASTLGIARTGFWSPVYDNDNKEPPQNSKGNYLGHYIIDYSTLIVALIGPYSLF